MLVADPPFDDVQVDLGKRVLECALLFARGKLRFDYVGLLLSDAQAADRIDTATPATRMTSFSVDFPDALVASCYEQLK